MTERASLVRSNTEARCPPLRLFNGKSLLIRSLKASDATLLVNLFQSHSDETRYNRYFTAIKALSTERAVSMVDLDNHSQLALGAFTQDGSRLLAVARFAKEDDPTRAEIAVTVHDDWQGKGIGTHLLSLLTRFAKNEGITHFTADVLATNWRMSHLIESQFHILEKERSRGIIHYLMPLARMKRRISQTQKC